VAILTTAKPLEEVETLLPFNVRPTDFKIAKNGSLLLVKMFNDVRGESGWIPNHKMSNAEFFFFVCKADIQTRLLRFIGARYTISKPKSYTNEYFAMETAFKKSSDPV